MISYYHLNHYVFKAKQLFDNFIVNKKQIIMDIYAVLALIIITTYVVFVGTFTISDYIKRRKIKKMIEKGLSTS